MRPTLAGNKTNVIGMPPYHTPVIIIRGLKNNICRRIHRRIRRRHRGRDALPPPSSRVELVRRRVLLPSTPAISWSSTPASSGSLPPCRPRWRTGDDGSRSTRCGAAAKGYFKNKMNNSPNKTCQRTQKINKCSIDSYKSQKTHFVCWSVS